MPAQQDWMDDDGARLLARRVARYWAKQKRGEVEVRVDISATGQGGIGTLHCVRSDMLNGYPRESVE